jgi:hypothetical protein
MDEPTLAPLPSARADEIARVARQTVRGWLSDPTTAAEIIAALGRSAIEAAAETSRRLAALHPAPADARGVLDMLQRLAEHATAQPPRGWRPFRKAPVPVDLEAELATVVQRLEDARDGLIRTATRLAGELDRITSADARLEEAVYLVRAIEAGVDAAVRELNANDPMRAQALRGAIGGGLDERLGDLLTQLAVTRQARLSLQLIRDGNDALSGAIERARSTMVAALRTAGLAVRAASEGERLQAQAAALDRSATGAAAARPARDAGVRRALDDAIAQVAAAQAAAAPRT